MRKLATAALAFSSAIFLSQYLLPFSWLGYCAVLSAALAFLGIFFKPERRLRFIIIMLFLAVGFAWNTVYLSVFLGPTKALNNKTATVSAVVADYPQVTDYGSTLQLIIRQDGASDVRAQLYLYGEYPNVAPGNTVEITARFRFAETMYGEKTDSYLSRGITLLATTDSTLIVTDDSTSILYLPSRIAHAMSLMTQQIFPDDAEAFMRALLLGEKSGVYQDTSLTSALSATGTSHIVAVSGMHVAFLMGLLGLLIKRKWLLAVIGIPVVILFMAVVGFHPSITRAGIMQIFLICAPLFKRERDTITALSASLMLIVLCNPYSISSTGLHLSFAATLGIVLFTEKIYTALDAPLHRRKLYAHSLVKGTVRFIIASLATTLGALVFSIPLVALHFGSVSIIAPLANLLVLWAVTLAFCGGIGAVLLGFIAAPLGTVAAFLVALPVRHVIGVTGLLARIPFASVYTDNTAVIIWLVYIYLMLITIIALRIKGRQLVYPISLSVVSLCLVLVLTSVFSGIRGFTVTVLDVGQGQSVVLTDNAFTAVVDCGSTSGKDAGDLLVKHLISDGRLTIDLLILTHYHSDHAGGIVEVLERIPVSTLAVPDPAIDDSGLPTEILALAHKKGIEIITVTENLVVTAGGTTLTLCAPLGSESENERGLSIICSHGDFDVLLTGDMSANIELRLIALVPLPDIEVLIAGHHGSKYSTSDELLHATTPELAIISSGYNSYGHPAPETLFKLLQAGITVYRTDLHGDVSINAW